MSDFSNKCREYLKDTGENVYQLSASSGLDRTSLQRMITGKRLPGIDFVRQFCDSLRINPSQRRELMELYKIEKIGKEIYYNRKYIQELLGVISSQQVISEGTEKHTIFILTLIKKKKSIRVFMILVDFLLDEI